MKQEITMGSIIPINQAIQFADKFPDEIKDKTQLDLCVSSLRNLGVYRSFEVGMGGQKWKKKIGPFLDLCVSSLRRGHANLLCIVPILSDVPEGTSITCYAFLYKGLQFSLFGRCGSIWFEAKH